MLLNKYYFIHDLGETSIVYLDNYEMSLNFHINLYQVILTDLFLNIFDKVRQKLATGRWFSPGPPVSSTNKTEGHDIIEILLKVALNTIKPTQTKPSTHCTNILNSINIR
jgi:hypothetical protein